MIPETRFQIQVKCLIYNFFSLFLNEINETHKLIRARASAERSSVVRLPVIPSLSGIP